MRKKRLIIFSFSFCIFHLHAQLKMNFVEKLVYTSVYIENYSNDGSISSGTGFYFSFTIKKGDSLISVPTIITNKHVVENAKQLSIVMHSRDSNNLPKDEDPIIVPIPGNNNLIVAHPGNVDLCAIMIFPIIDQLEKLNKKPSYTNFGEMDIPVDSVWKNLLPIEGVYMIGFPSGLFDSKSFLPIVRRGITASHPSKLLNSRNEFLVDIAAFSGSSGSPVFILNQNEYSDKKSGGTVFGTRFMLLGILYAEPLSKVEGNLLKFEPTPMDQRRYQSQVPMNLGYVIRADELNEIRKEIEKRANETIVHLK